MDYPLFDCVALKDGIVAVHGLILYKSGKTKYHIATKNIHTEEEKPVTHYMAERKGERSFTISAKNLDNADREKMNQEYKEVMQIFTTITNPAQAFRVHLSSTSNGDMIVGYSKEPQIFIYDTNGREKARITLNYSPEKISQQEKDEYIASMEKVIKAYAVLPDSTIEIIKSPHYFPEYLPYYYNITTDSDNNVLVFKFGKDKEHVFRVYQVFSNSGNFICETTLDPGEYTTPKTKLPHICRPMIATTGLLKDISVYIYYCRFRLSLREQPDSLIYFSFASNFILSSDEEACSL